VNSRLETVLSIIIAASALAVASVVVYRQVNSDTLRGARTAAPRRVQDWESVLSEAHWIGDPGAKVRIVEFSDFQCPFCKRFHETFSLARAALGDDVALAYIHFPLASHAYAEPAAVVADCAAEQGRFGEMASLLFAQQDSFGLKPWERYADGIGLRSAHEFEDCIARGPVLGRFDRLREMGSRVPVRGTPTVLVNGWLLPAPPTPDTLIRIARDLIAGRKAF